MTAAAPLARRHGSLESGAAWMFLMPTVVLLGLFVLVPTVWAAGISLQRTNGFGVGVFDGFGNYGRLAADPVFWRSIANTLLFTVLVTPLSMVLGLGAALLMNSVLPARGVFRSILILPMAVSGVATALVGLLIFDENNGILNALLRAFGLPAVSWQSGGAPAFASVVVVTLWWRVGFNMLIYLAGLQGVDPLLAEAATLDGATAWQRVRSITVPLLAPSTFFLVILNVVYSFQVFDIVFVLTGGGPENATSVLVTYAYNNAFQAGDQGLAAAIGMVLLLLSLAFTALQWRVNRSGRDITG